MDSQVEDLEKYSAMINRPPMIPDMHEVNRLDEFKMHCRKITAEVDHELILTHKTFQKCNVEEKHSVRIDAAFNAANARMKYISSVTEIEQLQEEIKKYQTEVNSLWDKLDDIKIEASNSSRIYDTITKLYSKAFQFELNILSFDGDHYKCEINFIFDGKPSGKSLFLNLDGKRKELLDFDARLLCTKMEEKEFREWYRETKNLPGLICKLRNKLKGETSK